MIRLPKLSKHDRPFSQEDLKKHMGDENNWFTRGSWLYQASEREYQFASSVENPKVIVGEPVAAMIQDKYLSKLECERTAAMLFAMAVECWLKGLILMAMPRTSKGVRQRAQAVYDYEVTANLEVGVDHTRAILNALDDPKVKALSAKYDRTRREEDQGRDYTIRKGNRGHDLRLLALKAKLKGRLGKQDLEFLDRLSAIIMIGRYPMPFNGSDVQPLEGVIDDVRRRDRIRQAIFERYKALENKST